MRVLRLEGDFWFITGEHGKLDAGEQKELKDYFDETGLPYQMKDGCPRVPGKVVWAKIHELLELFYDGRADIYPF